MVVENKAQEDFLLEYARTILVEWCAQETLHADGSTIAQAHSKLLELALDKGWVTKRVPHKITAKGYSVAAAFLRR